jgi:Zn-dependent protease with chaperone function
MSHALFLTHGMTLALAWFLAVDVAACALVACLAVTLARLQPSRPPIFWFGMRVLPAGAAVAFVAIVFLPSYWKYEPRDLVEGFDVTLTALALVAATILVAAAVRGGSAWRRASIRARHWMRNARPVTFACASVPAFEIDADEPVMALVGVVRPRLLVTRGLVTALTRAELDASIAHELGHQRAWDNLKRLAMRAAPDVLTWLPAARALEARWVSASEHAADRRAGERGAAARCALASALVKVARLTPSPTPAAEPICTLVGGGDIASRVERLLDDQAFAIHARGSSRSTLGAAVAMLLVAMGYAPLLRVVHQATEVLVHVLP